MDALKVYVFGFQTHEKAEPIRQFLEEAGFTIEMAVDADADSSGGCIETNIVHEGDLVCDVDNIRKAVHDVCPDAWLHWCEYDLVQEGDHKATAGMDNADGATRSGSSSSGSLPDFTREQFMAEVETFRKAHAAEIKQVKECLHYASYAATEAEKAGEDCQKVDRLFRQAYQAYSWSQLGRSDEEILEAVALATEAHKVASQLFEARR